MTRLSNWLVTDPLTEAVGREFARFTYLGPFLSSASLFAEDDPRIPAKLLAASGADASVATPESMRPVVTSLQQEIELTRNLLHKAGHKRNRENLESCRTANLVSFKGVLCPASQ